MPIGLCFVHSFSLYKVFKLHYFSLDFLFAGSQFAPLSEKGDKEPSPVSYCLLLFFPHIKISLRYMAVPAGILVQILLVIFFRRIEILKRPHFNRQLHAALFFFPRVHRHNLGQLPCFRIIDSCPILNPSVISLPVHRQRIDDHEVILKKLRERYFDMRKEYEETENRPLSLSNERNI